MALGSREQQLAVSRAGEGVHDEAEPFEMADRFIVHQNGTGFGQSHRQQPRVRTCLAHQHGGTAVDEAFGQSRVERIGQACFNRTGTRGHLILGQNPVGALRNVRPRPDRRNASLQRIDIA